MSTSNSKKNISQKNNFLFNTDSYFHDMYAMQLALLKHWYQEHFDF